MSRLALEHELPKRDPFVGPPAPPQLPEDLPTVELMEKFVAAVQEWGKN